MKDIAFHEVLTLIKEVKYLFRKAGFDADQPRDDLGRWTDDGGSIGNDTTNDLTGVRVGETGRVIERTPKEVSQHIRDISEKHNWARPETLQDKFERHGSDFGDKNPEDTARRTLEFREKAIEKKFPAVEYPKGGKIIFYDSKTNTIAAYGRDGKSLTSFKPEEGAKYFEDLIKTQTSRGGRIINPLPGSEGESLGGGSDIMHPKKPAKILPDDEILKNYSRLIERKYFHATEDCVI